MANRSLQFFLCWLPTDTGAILEAAEPTVVADSVNVSEPVDVGQNGVPSGKVHASIRLW